MSPRPAPSPSSVRTSPAGGGPAAADASRRTPNGRATTRPSSDAARRRTALGVLRRHAGDESGFTLVELLVVVLVLGALVAIAVPTFIGQRESAWDAALRSELRAASIALESYRAQNGAYTSQALTTGWGYEASGTIVFDELHTFIESDAYCIIGDHVDALRGSRTHRWRATSGGGVERIAVTGGSCTSSAVPAPSA
jgi:type IV pilus assembly protein PilA